MVVIQPDDDVRDITNPQLVRGGRNKVLNHIGLCRKTVRGVRGAGFSHLQPYLQVVLVDDVSKPVAPNWIVALKVAPVHMPKLDTTYSGVLCPDILDIFQGKGFPGHAGHDLVFIVLVICLL